MHPWRWTLLGLVVAVLAWPNPVAAASMGRATDCAAKPCVSEVTVEEGSVPAGHACAQSLALDIALTQPAQIGWMSGWLDLWDVPQGSPGVRMAWMGHPTKGRMPGMASREEVAALRTDSTTVAEKAFLPLMIEHHQAGVDMAEAAVQGATQLDARFFAEKMVTGQRAEIETLRDMLAQRGEANPADEGHDKAPGAAPATATPTPGR